MDFSWEIDILSNVIENMKNGTTDTEFLLEQLTSVMDSVEDKEELDGDYDEDEDEEY